MGLTLVVGFAAVNAGNNLLYLIFGLMLSFITVSGILSEFMLRKLRMTRTFPRHIFAQQNLLVSLSLTNKKKYISSLSLSIEDLSQNNSAEQSRYLLIIPPQKTETIFYSMTFSRRGLQRPGTIRISTHYPFGFFRKSATFSDTDDEVLVYPAVNNLMPADLSGISGLVGELNVPRHRGSSAEIYSVREYVQGDHQARIHWKSSAKLATLMIKELEAEQRKKIALYLDLSSPQTPIPSTRHQEIEQAISVAASYAVYFSKKDFHIQLITPAQKSISDRGMRHLFRILRILALLQPVNGRSSRHFSHAIQAFNRTDAINILIAVNTAEEYPQGNFSKVIRVHST